MAGPPPATLTIAAGSLANALRELALRSGRSILFPPALVAGQTVRAMRLPSNVEAALEHLLDGTGLVARQNDMVLRIERARPPEFRSGLKAAPPPDEGSIVVTASRRPTLLDDTPISMTVIGAEELEAAHVVGLGDVAALAPSFAVTSIGSGIDRLSLRGVSAAGEATVGLYYGETPVVGPGGTTSDAGLMTPSLRLVDVDRVEVLRGPQGTLYGGGSLAGTVRVLFKDPDLHAVSGTAHLDTTWYEGSNPGATASVTANLPLAEDKLAIRLVGYHSHSDGIIDNITLHLRNTDRRTESGGRAALSWAMSPEWRIGLTTAYQHTLLADALVVTSGTGVDRTSRPVRLPFASRLLTLNGVLHGRIGSVMVDATVSQLRWSPHRRFDFTATEQNGGTDRSACARYLGLAADCGNADLASWQAYVNGQTPTILDQPLHVRSDSAEMRLSHVGRLTWTAGLFTENRRDSGSSQTLPVDPATGLPRAGANPLSFRDFSTQLTQYAAFADVTWRVSPIVDLTAGGRYFDFQRSAKGVSTILNPVTDMPSAPIDQSDRAHGTVGRARIDLRPAAHLLFYASISGGFRPGGINVVPGLDPAISVYRDDRLVSYEGGARIGFGPVSLDAAVYRLDWTDMQFPATTKNGAFAFITNIGRAHISGGELGFTLTPSRTFKARFEGTYTDARLAADQLSATAAGSGLKGDRLPQAAPLAIALTLTETMPLVGELALRSQIRARYVGTSYSTFRPNDPNRVRLGNLGTVDLDVAIVAPHWSAGFYIDNLTDQRRILVASPANLGVGGLLFSPPRTFGLQLDRSF